VHVTRRTILRIGSFALAAPAARMFEPLPGAAQTGPVPAPSPDWRHGLSLFGDLHYRQGFERFDYVNAVAPRGGTVRLSALGTFDNFNVVVASVKGQLAAGVGLIYNRLLASALDEVTTMYGFLAEAVDYPPDHSRVAYRLRPEARWHDGKPVTADDVIFSFEAWKQYDPELAAYYRHVVKAERIGER
jgi:microcin C transport system substrate-binding protein